MTIKNLIIDTLPYGIVRNYIAKRYKEKCIIKLDSSLSDIPESESKFKNIVSVQGFGFSGSGAVVDFLREFSSCLVLGSIDNEGSVAEGNRHLNGEIDFLRHAGGLFEIEKYLEDNNLFTKDAVLKRFIKLVNNDMMFHNERMSQLINQFYNQIIDFEIDTKGHNDYNSHLSNVLYPDSNIRIMKNLGQTQYRDLCRRLFVSMMNLFYEDKYEYLVLDQLCGDYNFDYNKYVEYIPNLKMIMVFRDPRDTYAYALMKDVPWIPHDDVEKFIKWYQTCKRSMDFNSTNYLSLRFEDIVLDYVNTSKRIVQYLCLDIKDHKGIYSCLDPKESAKNISIWKKIPDYSNDMDMILHAFPEMCFVE